MVAIIKILTILTPVIPGTVEVEIVADEITETEILATAIVDTRIGIREDEMEGIEDAEVAEDAGDVAEETEIDPTKATMHAQFMEDTSGVNVSLTLTGITTDQGTVTVTETARVEETARGEATPTI